MDEMPDWWLRVPLYNAPLTDEMDIRGIVLRPRLSWYEARRAVQDAQRTAWRYVATGDAIVHVGDAEDRPSDPWTALAEAGFWDMRDALHFILQRDVCAHEGFFHQTADCTDEAKGPVGWLTINRVPYASNIQTRSMESWLRDAMSAWSDDRLEEETGFQYAARFQHVVDMPGLLLETEFLQQWIAFELLLNRWCETEPTAPKTVRISDGVMKRHVRPALKRALRELSVAGHITENEAKALVRDIRPRVFGNPDTKAEAFLQHIGVPDVPRTWLTWGSRLRNKIAHGHSWLQLYASERPTVGEPRHDLDFIRGQARLLVNRAVMGIVGYQPDAWCFAECRVGFYRKV